MLFAHKDIKMGTSQMLEEHLESVAEEMCRDIESVAFEQVSNICVLLKQIGRMHDIGKATSWFQNYLDTGKGNVLKNHALLSAAILYTKCHEISNQDLFAIVAVYRHHRNLSMEWPADESDEWQYLIKQYDNCCKQLCTEGFYIKIDTNFDEEQQEKFRKIWIKVKKRITKEKNLENFFLLQFLFSKLISSDKKDSADLLKKDSIDVSNQNKKGISGNVEKYLELKIGNQKFTIDERREQIRATVLQQISKLTLSQVKEQRIFTLTAPTGTGKTLTSIAAALNLAEKMKAIGENCTHIITAVPFLNILEQTQKDYEEIFEQVIVHSSVSDPLKRNIVEYHDGDGKDLSLQKKMLLVSSWTAPVILTTFVQFFESIVTDSNSKLVKLQSMVGAIVILDEVQALEIKEFPLFATIIYRLSKHYGTRFILMTATQPQLFNVVEECSMPPMNLLDSVKIMELLPDYKSYFHELERTCLVPVMDTITSLESLADFVISLRKEQQSILTVVNKIADSIKLYNQLKESRQEVLYLSTNIVSTDRKAVIQKAKEYLEQKKSFIMVSTQTIEAGVDLDFDIAFRDFAPLESIIQTAGRVNRAGDKGKFCPVYIFDTGSAKNIYKSSMTLKVTKRLIQGSLKENIEHIGIVNDISNIQRDFLSILECEYQVLIEEYYKEILKDKVELDWDILEEGILPLNYEKIQKFKMIKEEDRCSIIFIKNKEIEQDIERLCQCMIHSNSKDYEAQAKIQQYFTQIAKYIVDVYPNKLKENKPMTFAAYSKICCGVSIDLNYFVVPYDDLERYYDEFTGYIAKNPEAYIY